MGASSGLRAALPTEGELADRRQMAGSVRDLSAPERTDVGEGRRDRLGRAALHLDDRFPAVERGVWREDDIRQAQEWIVGSNWLPLEDVERSPPRWPEWSASTSAAWSTTPPRDVLTRYAPGFMKAIVSAFSR